MRPETTDRGANHSIVTPAQQQVRHKGSEAHRPLHHLDSPDNIDMCSLARWFQRHKGGAFEVAVDSSVDQAFGMATAKLDPQLHTVGNRWRYRTAQHRATAQTVTVRTHLPQPPAPPLELV
ncbi:MAG: hypothetical protein M3063_14870 [Actinomycetota bacterium]|nr:hypothetical protein [Actinomycetota bacterium]